MADRRIIVVYPPDEEGARRVRVDGSILSRATDLQDLAIWLRRAGLDGIHVVTDGRGHGPPVVGVRQHHALGGGVARREVRLGGGGPGGGAARAAPRLQASGTARRLAVSILKVPPSAVGTGGTVGAPGTSLSGGHGGGGPAHGGIPRSGDGGAGRAERRTAPGKRSRPYLNMQVGP
ncbi:hypothetical protein [Streptomyces sp. NPDC006691]|uniref:hypothetical protein n=1 Tax=Streptomyces sp. NPDC006691 TaxID=3364757 RepID=UPI003698305E